MKLTKPTDAELNAAFAEKVCGYRITDKPDEWALDDVTQLYILPAHKGGDVMIGKAWRSISFPEGHHSHTWTLAQFTTSADAVLPWLEKGEYFPLIRRPFKDIVTGERIWEVELTGTFGDSKLRAYAETLPKAAVIALLRAHGVEVEFTK